MSCFSFCTYKFQATSKPSPSVAMQKQVTLPKAIAITHLPLLQNPLLYQFYADNFTFQAYKKQVIEITKAV